MKTNNVKTRETYFREAAEKYGDLYSSCCCAIDRLGYLAAVAAVNSAKCRIKRNILRRDLIRCGITALSATAVFPLERIVPSADLPALSFNYRVFPLMRRNLHARTFRIIYLLASLLLKISAADVTWDWKKRDNLSKRPPYGGSGVKITEGKYTYILEHRLYRYLFDFISIQMK